ncbi:secretory carrier-associated membrane protein 3 isoform X2 [Meriones unguiculatus]|uniref:secretory carrier-associated membrane protein 3 isoform X2 n=1 Tax=Meriones unguiculatus TaxID=10047 RepID=UPI00293E2A4A|nr:secretory carrier-associated membrane protein 3 isoform X2 [Meriones unguiculatus]
MAQSRDGGNPFPDSGELDNPFQPPPAYTPPTPAPATLPPPSAPTVQSSRKLSPAEPKNYGSYSTQASAAAATAELLKKQEELNRKAEELDRRERELQHVALGGTGTRQNNWPPLPSFCPVQPCFFQDISMEIPQEFQKTVSTMYYLWMCSTVALLLNFLACLARFCVDTSSGSGFGLSLLWLLLFTPCSFVCWYRPMYKAFRSDSSFNFFVFFFIFFVQDVFFVLQAIGIPGWGFRSTPCIAEQVPAFRRPSKNLQLVCSLTLQFELLPPVQLQGLLKMPSGPHDPYWDALALPPWELRSLSLKSLGFREAPLLGDSYGTLNSTAMTLNLTWRCGKPTGTQSLLAFISHLATLLPPLTYPKPSFPLLCQGCLLLLFKLKKKKKCD